jgi:hypothetical protein
MPNQTRNRCSVPKKKELPEIPGSLQIEGSVCDVAASIPGSGYSLGDA